MDQWRNTITWISENVYICLKTPVFLGCRQNTASLTPPRDALWEGFKALAVSSNISQRASQGPLLWSGRDAADERKGGDGAKVKWRQSDQGREIAQALRSRRQKLRKGNSDLGALKDLGG